MFRNPAPPGKDVKLTVARAVAGLMKFCFLVTSVWFLAVCVMICSRPVFCQTSQSGIEKPSISEAGSFPLRPAMRKEGMTSLDLLLEAPKNSGPRLAEISREQVLLKIDARDVPANRWKGVHVQIINNTKHSIVCDGDNAAISSDNARISALSMNTIASTIVAPDNPGRGLISKTAGTARAAVTIGGAQAVHGQIQQWGPVLDRYGWDEKRREVQVNRLGKRALYPGECTEGNIFFAKRLPVGAITVQVPIFILYNEKDSAIVSATLEALGSK